MAFEAGVAFIRMVPSFLGFQKATQKGVTKTLAASGAAAAAAGKGLTAAVTLPLVGVGALAVKAAHDYDKAMATIRVGTGATGKTLDGLGESFRKVNKEVPNSTGDVATAIADLNTRTGATGPTLERLAKQTLNLARITGTEVGPLIAGTTRVFGDWGISTDKQSEALDYLFKVSQSTGIGIDSLSRQVVQFGAPMRQMGFSFEQSAALLGKFEKEGVNGELVMGSLRIAIGKLARAGKDPVKGFTEMTKKIRETGDAGKANSLAMELFGARAGPDMAAAIREGRFDIEELLGTLAKSPETINGAAKASLTTAERFALLRKRAEDALVPLGTGLISAGEKLLPMFQRLVQGLNSAVRWFNQASPATRRFVLILGGVLLAAGPVLIIFGKIASAIATLIPIIVRVAKVMRLLSLFFVTNPIGLVIVALVALGAALVVAYRRSETFRNIVQAAWRGIQTAVSFAWHGVIKPVVTALVSFWHNVLAPVFMWLYNNVVKPAFAGIVAYFRIWWAVAKAIFAAVRAVIVNVLAPVFMWLYRNVVLPVFAGIVAYIRLSWTVLRGIFNAVKFVITKILAPVFVWLWRNVIGPAFAGIRWSINAAWVIIQVIFYAIKFLVQKVVAPVILWLWRNVVAPVFRFIGAIIRAWWIGTKAIFGAVIGFIRGPLAGVIRWIWRNIVSPVFSAIGRHISAVWNRVIRPVFSALGSFVRDKVVPVFRKGVDLLGKAWDKLKGFAKAPVRFVIDTVINKGIIGTINKAADLLKVPKGSRIGTIPLPRGFAGGGFTGPGRKYDPAGIVHAGEFVLRKEATASLMRRSPGVLEEMNATGAMPGYASGGLVGLLKGPVNWLKDRFAGPIDKIKDRFGGGSFVKILSAIPRQLIGWAVDWVKSKLSLFGGGDGGSKFLGNDPSGAVGAILAVAKKFYPGARVSSGYRNTPDFHGRGLAADLIGGGAAGMKRIAAGFYRHSGRLIELIHSNGSYFVKNGRRVGASYYRSAIPDHYDHVHVAARRDALAGLYDNGGMLPPGLSLAYNATRRPEPVLTDSQWNAVMSGTRGGDGNTYQFTFAGRESFTEREAVEAMERAAVMHNL